MPYPTCRNVVGVLTLIMVLMAGSAAQAQQMPEFPFASRMNVQRFPDGLDWLNAAGPIRPIELSELRGRFVLLDFWTYCCINCMHVLPELKKLEKAYPEELVVIGVHSAKFDNEKDTQNITEAVARHNIEHPVVNDSQMILWKRFGVQSWPTLLLIDPEGHAVWGRGGEATFEQLDEVLKKALPYYRKRKLLRPRPFELGLANDPAEKTPLRFPGKVLADEASRRLFIADSNHNRIVVTRLDGTLLETIGAGSIGLTDGDYSTAQFQQPQGMALVGKMLYVADTENHLIRKIDLDEKRVTTLAGIGSQARKPLPPGPALNPLKTALSSPWALWPHGEHLYIAMAGPHQIWRMPLDGSAIGVYAGNGREDIVDGRLLPPEPYQMGYSSFAQPSGLASDGTWLYVADSEGSSIRAVPFTPRTETKTVVGTAHLPGARLFTFGDVDGTRNTVRLQHPLGVVHYEGTLYVADTYNNKIKAINPTDGTTRTIAGTGQPGLDDDGPTFNEPAGISAAFGRLYVADTNNHVIRVIDLQRGNTVSTLQITGLGP
ncbi:MAG: thioredoxin-like domain-containing protein [Thermoguttaceae bacterium]